MSVFDWTDALLPTGEKMNPANPQDAYYFDNGQIAFVMESKAGTHRVFTGFGGSAEAYGYVVGSRHSIRHDQTCRHLGEFTVVGWHVFATGEKAGLVPDRQIKHWVFK